MKFIFPLIICFFFISCEEKKEVFKSKSTPISTLYNKSELNNELEYNLLTELNICADKSKPDSLNYGKVACSGDFFAFYKFSENISKENAFMLQVRKGVNGFQRRRLLIFAREKGDLVLVNGIVGYLVEKRTTSSGFDDLVVALVDNVAGTYERYDVLLNYNNGKYEYKEALGDIQGTFNTEELKKEASKQIGQRIKDHELIF